MGYNKIIISGNTLEIYQYEKDIIIYTRTSVRKHKDILCDDDLGIDREHTLQERKLGKRQDNAKRASMAFRRIIASNLEGPDKPLLVTLTYRDNITDLKESYRHLSSFIQSLRHKFGKAFKYACVPEFQKRGAVHYHALFWGLPEEVFLLERKTREISGLWGWGHVFMKQTDGHKKLSFYLSKYMTKAFIDPRLKNQKGYVASRNIKKPTIIKNISSTGLWTIFDEYMIDTKESLVDREYPTRWLGNGRYRIFKIKND